MSYSLRSKATEPVPDGPNPQKPFIIILLFNFCFNNFAEKPNLGIPQAVPDHALLLEV